MHFVRIQSKYYLELLMACEMVKKFMEFISDVKNLKEFSATFSIKSLCDVQQEHCPHNVKTTNLLITMN